MFSKNSSMTDGLASPETEMNPNGTLEEKRQHLNLLEPML
jgi:hypothetical protein